MNSKLDNFLEPAVRDIVRHRVLGSDVPSAAALRHAVSRHQPKLGEAICLPFWIDPFVIMRSLRKRWYLMRMKHQMPEFMRRHEPRIWLAITQSYIS